MGFEEKKNLVLSGLGPVAELKTDEFARSIYHDLASSSAIDNFLKTSRFYSLSDRRWKLPQTYSKLLDTSPYTPLRNIISAVVRRFWRDASRQHSREVVDTHATDLRHSVEDPPTHTSRPSLVIKAKGSSFQLPFLQNQKSRTKLGFSNIAACIEIKVDGDELPISEQLAQAAIYARQMFLHQPHRRFVRVLSLTGHHLRLFHFDRSGLQYTPALDIDNDPHTFVRVILGLSSPNEADLGLDPSIEWKVESGRKVSGTVTTRGADDTDKVYTLVEVDPIFSRNRIYGRGTICWIVSDLASGRVLVVKDSWRLNERTGEYVHLQEALGVPGVAQMVSCEPNRGQVNDLRSLGPMDPVDFENRIETPRPFHIAQAAAVCSSRRHCRYINAVDAPARLRGLALGVDQHYDGILRIFDAGIEALVEFHDEESTATAGAPSIAPSPPQSSPLKRVREAETDTQPAAKRLNLSAQG